MGTHTCSQTHALGTQVSPHFNPLSLFESDRCDPESAKHFCGFSLLQQQATSASASKACTESPTLGACIKEYSDSEASPIMSFHSSPYSVHTPIQNPPGAPGIPGGDPPNYPLGNDHNSDFDSLNTSDAEDADPAVVFANLAKAIKSLAKSLYCNPSKTSQCTKVQEPDQFDGTDPHKLWVFLVQCELNFQNCPQAFTQDHTKVIFMQSYLKGITLEWFELDFLLIDDSDLCPFWIENYKEFVLELQINFGPYDPVRDMEHQLDHLC